MSETLSPVKYVMKVGKDGSDDDSGKLLRANVEWKV